MSSAYLGPLPPGVQHCCVVDSAIAIDDSADRDVGQIGAVIGDVGVVVVVGADGLVAVGIGGRGTIAGSVVDDLAAGVGGGGGVLVGPSLGFGGGGVQCGVVGTFRYQGHLLRLGRDTRRIVASGS